MLVKQGNILMFKELISSNLENFLLQGIFPTQGSNLGLPHSRQTLYRLSHREVPIIWKITKREWLISQEY